MRYVAHAETYDTGRTGLRLKAAMNSVVRLALVAVLAIAACTGVLAQPPLRAPDVHYQPTPQEAVDEMLRLAQVSAKDLVYDLGCGDGRIVITAVRDYGARGVCIDIDPVRIAESRANAQRAGVETRIEFRNQDLFQARFEDASVVALFLWPSLNLKLRPILFRQLKPGTRVVSYVHDMGDWKPERTIALPNGRRLHLWVMPGSQPAL